MLRSSQYRRSTRLIHRMAESSAEFRQGARLPKLWVIRRRRNLPLQNSRYFPPRGTAPLSRETCLRDQQNLQARSRQVRLRGNVDETQYALPASRPSGPFPDTASPRGRSPRRISFDRIGKAAFPRRRNMFRLQKDRFALCPESRQCFRRDGSPAPLRVNHHQQLAPCPESRPRWPSRLLPLLAPTHVSGTPGPGMAVIFLRLCNLEQSIQESR